MLDRQFLFDPMTNLNIKIILKPIFLIIIALILTGCGFKSDESLKAYNEFAIKSAKMGLWNEAIMRWERLVSAEPNNAKYHNNLAVAYEAKGELDLALAHYEKAIKLDPENKAYRYNYMKCKMDHDKHQKKVKPTKLQKDNMIDNSYKDIPR
ncbi:MAG: tetratricopeptide repeat protein [Candidatus Poribacteria bacterium]